MALLRAHAELESAAEEDPTRGDRESVRLFTSGAIDTLLFRAHPALPALVYVPLAAAMIALAVHARLGAVAIAVLVPLGVLAWTLVEYLLHRFGLHLPRTTHAWRVVFTIVHGHHHVAPRDKTRIVAPPVMAASLMLLLWGLSRLALGALAPPFFAGLCLGYVAYEAVHYVVHRGRPFGPLRAVARHHLAHHHQTPDKRFGISSPLWDHVLGTAG